MEVMDNADVLYEILLRLPVKTLKRFECVSKSWFSLISSPQFLLGHFRRAQQNPLVLTLQSEENIWADPILDDMPTLRFSAYNTKEEFTLINNFFQRVDDPCFYGTPLMLSCRGLVCISSWNSILVCNPSTQELISLPPAEHPTSCVGFGYAASTQEFKVVSFFFDKEKSCCRIFTLGTNRWREARSPPFELDVGTAPFLHQAFHFLPWISSQFKGTGRIAVMDINTEEYREEILLPEFYQTFRCSRLAKLGGCLCLTFFSMKLRDKLEVWLLKDYCSAEWVKGYTINVSSVYSYPGHIISAYLTDTMGDESILLNCFDEIGLKLLCYDPHYGTLTMKKDKEWGATFYVESFYPLRSR